MPILQCAMFVKVGIVKIPATSSSECARIDGRLFDVVNKISYAPAMASRCSRGFILVVIVSAVISCGPPTITYVPMPMPVPTPATTSNAPPAKPEKLAVLPIEDEKLFRVERLMLRFELAGHLARVLPDRTIVPLTEVNTKLQPISEATGRRCAFDGEELEKRARYKGWQITRLSHVAGIANGRGEELWVDILDGLSTVVTFRGPWNYKLPRVDAYRGAFAALVKDDAAAILGGLGALGSYKDALIEGPLTVCEAKNFGACDAASVDWNDRIAQAKACFAGADEVTRDLLVQGDVGPYCEMENLDDPGSPDLLLEQCLCKTLGTSEAMKKRPGRRTIRVHYESPDLQGKPRPELRLLETSSNLEPEDDWHSMEVIANGRKEYHSIRRFAVDNLDSLAAPLARCAVASGTIVLADVDVREDGVPTAGHVVSNNVDKPTTTCIEQALTHGTFKCTSDGVSGRMRLAMQWR